MSGPQAVNYCFKKKTLDNKIVSSAWPPVIWYFTELKWGSMLVVIAVLLQSDQLLLNCKKRSLTEGMQQLFSVAWTNDKYFLLILYYNTIWKSKSPRHFNTLVPWKFILLLLKRLRFLPVVHALLSMLFLHISPSVLSSSPLVSHLLGLLFNKSHKPSIPWKLCKGEKKAALQFTGIQRNQYKIQAMETCRSLRTHSSHLCEV